MAPASLPELGLDGEVPPWDLPRISCPYSQNRGKFRFHGFEGTFWVDVTGAARNGYGLLILSHLAKYNQFNYLRDN